MERRKLSAAEFIQHYFGSDFDTNSLAFQYTYRAGIGGSIAVAKVGGNPDEIKRVLSQAGLSNFYNYNPHDVAGLISPRFNAMDEDSKKLLPSDVLQPQYKYGEVKLPDGTREFYVAADGRHFIMVDIRK